MPSRSATDQPRHSDMPCSPDRHSGGGRNGISGGQAAAEIDAFTEAHCNVSGPRNAAGDALPAIVHDGSSTTACSSSAPASQTAGDATVRLQALCFTDDRSSGGGGTRPCNVGCSQHAVPDARHAALKSSAAAAALCASPQPALGSHQHQLQHDLQLSDSLPAIDPGRGVSPFSLPAARSPWDEAPDEAILPVQHLPRACIPITPTDSPHQRLVCWRHDLLVDVTT